MAPSGDKYLVRKPGSQTFMKLLELISADRPEGMPTRPEDVQKLLDDPEAMREAFGGYSGIQLAQMTELLFTNCILKPKVVFEEPDEDSDDMYFEDIDPEDYIFLLTKLTELSGVSPEALKRIFFHIQQSAG